MRIIPNDEIQLNKLTGIIVYSIEIISQKHRIISLWRFVEKNKPDTIGNFT